jgi:hypothetical protein
MDDPFVLQQLAHERISEITHVASEQSRGRAAVQGSRPGHGLLLDWRCSIGQVLVHAGLRLIGPDARR